MFSQVAHDALRVDDYAGRYGGEEFVFVFPQMVAADVLAIVERFRSGLRSATESGACPQFTASFGVAEWQPGMTVDTILGTADGRLLAAKAAGRDCVIVADVDESAVPERANS